MEDFESVVGELDNFYSAMEEVPDDVSSYEEEIEEEDDQDDAGVSSSSNAVAGFQKYTLRLGARTNKEYVLARFFPEDVPTVQSSLSRVYRQGEETVEARREEIAAEKKFLKEQYSFLGSRRAKRQASEGVVKLPPRSRKKWYMECVGPEDNVKKFVGSLDGEPSASYALFILDDERNEADFVPLDKYCRYHFRSLLPSEQDNSQADAEEAERKIHRRNRVEQKEWERLPNNDTKSETVPLLGSTDAGALSVRPSYVETKAASSLLPKEGVTRKKAKTSAVDDDLDYEEKFEDDDVSLGEEQDNVEQTEEKELSEDESQALEYSKDRSSGKASSTHRKRSHSEETASIGSASPSVLSSSESDNEDSPNLSHFGKEIRRLLRKEKFGIVESDLSSKKRRVADNAPVDTSSSNSGSLEATVRDIFLEYHRKGTPISLHDFTFLVAKRWPKIRSQVGKSFDPKLVELIKQYTELRTDPETQELYLHTKPDAFE
jgi:hypothetical protein